MSEKFLLKKREKPSPDTVLNGNKSVHIIRERSLLNSNSGLCMCYFLPCGCRQCLLKRHQLTDNTQTAGTTAAGRSHIYIVYGKQVICETARRSGAAVFGYPTDMPLLTVRIVQLLFSFQAH